MDHQLKPSQPSSTHAPTTDLLRSMAQQLLSFSIEFEPFVPGAQRGPQETLQLLGTLEAVARKSLEEHARSRTEALVREAQARAAAAEAEAVRASMEASHAARMAQSQAARLATAAQKRVEYDSRNSGYRPALRDPSVVDALLALRSRSMDRNSDAHGTSSAKPSASSAKSAFQPSAPVIVDSTTRYETLPRRPGTNVPILRPKR